MKKVFVTLSLIFCMSIAVFSQNVVKLGDDLLTANSMEKSPKILSDGGMIIEPVEVLLGIDPELKIIASNGVEPQVPIMCTVEAMSKADKRISIITFIYNGNAGRLETNLRNLGYKFLDNGQYREYIHTFVSIRRNAYCSLARAGLPLQKIEVYDDKGRDSCNRSGMRGAAHQPTGVSGKTRNSQTSVLQVETQVS